MMDEVVNTSDNEEGEALHSLAPDYWPAVLQKQKVSLYTTNISSVPRPTGLQVAPLDSLSSPSRHMHMLRHWDTPPRKRLKLTNAASAYASLPSTPVKPLSKRDSADKPTSAPTSPILLKVTGIDRFTHIAGSSRGASIPHTHNRAVTESYNGDPCLSPDELGGYNQDPGHEDDVNRLSPRMRTPLPASSFYESGDICDGSRSTSVDPLSLFTPRKRKPPSRETARNDTASLSSRLHDVSSGPSSPLTPTSSSPMNRQPANSSSIATDRRSPVKLSPVRKSSPIQERPPRSPRAIPIDVLEIPDDQATGRYSLRARQARQLNPYAYDKALYKRQMRSNPDAIVKIVNPSRHRRQRSTSRGIRGDNAETEDEYEEDGEPQDDDEHDGWQVRHGRSRRDSSFHRQYNGDAQHGRDSSPQREAWYPGAFDESFSSDGMEEVLPSPPPEPPQNRDDTNDAPKRHRRQRFPMRLPKPPPPPVSPSSSQRRSPPPSPSPQPDVDLTADHDLDNEVLSLPRWRRHRSFASVGCPSSPLVASRRNSPLPHADGHASEGHDALPDLGSPELPPMSSTPIDVDILSAAENVFTISGGDGPRARETSSDQSRSGTPSSSDDDSDLDLSRRQLKALNKMMPRVMINKHLKGNAGMRPRRREARDYTPEDQPLAPGQSRVRMGHGSQREIRGDSESPDVEMADATVANSSSSAISSESEMDIVVGPILRRKSVSAGAGVGTSVLVHAFQPPSPDDDRGGTPKGYIDEDEISTWVSLPQKGLRARRNGGSYEAREGDLIDRMLSRTRVTGGKTRTREAVTGTGARTGASRRIAHRTGRQHGSSARKIDIVTPGARKIGPVRQTLLPFKPTSHRSSEPAEDRHAEAHGNLPRRRHRTHKDRPQDSHSDDADLPQREQPDSSATTSKRRQHPHKNKHGAAGVHTFASNEGHVTTGRIHQFVTLNTEVSETRKSLKSRQLKQSTLVGRQSPCKAKDRSDRPTLNTYWEADADVSDHEHVPPAPARVLKEDARSVSLDFGINHLPTGLDFGAESYSKRGWMLELTTLLATRTTPQPYSFSYMDIHVHPAMSSQEFVACLEKSYDCLRDLQVSNKVVTVEDSRQWQRLFHALSLHLSRLFEGADEGGYVVLREATQKHVARLNDFIDEPKEIIPEDEPPDFLTSELKWFLVEMVARLRSYSVARYGATETDDALYHVQVERLMDYLSGFDFSLLLSIILEQGQNTDDTVYLPRRVAELWVCTMYLTGAIPSATPSNPHQTPQNHGLFWSLYLRVIHTRLRSAPSDLVVSEAIWESAFSLSALSQFSIHGITVSASSLSASWQFVLTALDRIKLAADPGSDAKLSPRSLRKRDEYIRLLVSRCLILSCRWDWRLDSASALFNRLRDIFKSRRFANLSDEPSDFPSFLRHNNLQLLLENKRSDTAYTLLLKLVVHAAKDSQGAINGTQREEPAARISPKVDKLLSLCIPVGSVPFTKTTPPSGHDLSMLYNRFSAVAVAIYLEPTTANLKHRVGIARRYVNFKDTDHETRRACIRGLMHLTILIRHMRLPFDDLLDWLAEMTNVLMDEYQDAEVKGRATTWTMLCIQLLLGCVRRIIETPVMDSERTAQYPDPALLNGPWVTRIFSASPPNFSAVPTTGTEIRKLVQAFLDARSAVMPKPKLPQPAREEESQESQYDFEDLDINMEDPDLLDALGVREGEEKRRKDQILCEVIDAHISPAIYRLVFKHLNSAPEQTELEQYHQDADKWIDCWVGCANVLVQNGKRDWLHYLALGPQSWERIIGASWRRRVGLRFMLVLLRSDPSAYLKCQDHIIAILLESLVAHKATIEHEYAALVFNVDHLRHPLFRGVDCERNESEEYSLSRRQFLDSRLAIMRCILSNLSQLLEEEDDDIGQTERKQTYVGYVVSMLSAMRDHYLDLTPDSEGHIKYTSFCQVVYGCFENFPLLMTNPRLSPSLDWAKVLL